MTGGSLPGLVLGLGVPDDVFAEIAVILLVSALAGLVAVRLHQPLVVAFVAVGVVVGPSVLGVVQPGSELELFAELGVALLLFVVGLKLDLHVLRDLGPVALVVGAVQVVVIAGVGVVLALAVGMETEAALYVGIGLALSSTVIVVKLLSDRHEIDDLHGRLAVGILIVQDLVAVVVMIAVANAGEDESGSLAAALASAVLGGVALLVVLAALMRWVLTPLVHALARNADLLLLFAIAWAVGVAAASDAVGMGPEVGAFLAGFSLASTPYREAIGSRLVTVRDFLLLFFFIDLGSRLEPGEAVDQLAVALLLSAFVLIVKPLVIVALLCALRYRSRVALETGLSLAQISEFSLILAALGLRYGHIDEETTTLMIVVALVTIPASSYLLLNSETIARGVGPALRFLERAAPIHSPAEHEAPPDVVVVGLGRYGAGIVSGLRERDLAVLGVDFDPVALSRWAEAGVPVLYGDAEDPELAHLLPLPESGWIVSSIRRTDANLALLHALAKRRYAGRVAVAAHRPADAERLLAAGADRVLLPYASAARDVVELIAR
ncbi:MAG TPA: cation:proton antiporter [Gaiellaceae bacterium]|nr:cation:proton antiporter [Gaiellaceae bacterium]